MDPPEGANMTLPEGPIVHLLGAFFDPARDQNSRSI